MGGLISWTQILATPSSCKSVIVRLRPVSTFLISRLVETEVGDTSNVIGSFCKKNPVLTSSSVSW